MTTLSTLKDKIIKEFYQNLSNYVTGTYKFKKSGHTHLVSFQESIGPLWRRRI